MKKISSISLTPTDPETLQIGVQGTSVQLSRFDAIKLRNYLNQFINGDLEEEDEEPQDIAKQRIY